MYVESSEGVSMRVTYTLGQYLHTLFIVNFRLAVIIKITADLLMLEHSTSMSPNGTTVYSYLYGAT